MRRPKVSRKRADGLLISEAASGITSGKLDVDFAVTPRGTAALQVPLWIPVGRAGMQPDVALHYDSARGSDVGGVGWALSAGSRIARCQRDHLNDGRAEPVAFGIEDPYTLDGERLVLVQGIHGQDQAEYRTHENSFRRIILLAPDALGPTGFRVEGKDGRIYLYGTTARSRIEGKRVNVIVPPTGEGVVPGWQVDDDIAGLAASFNQDVRYAWLLREVTDRYGNSIIYEWQEVTDQSATPFFGQMPVETVLAEIQYTGRKSRSPRRKPGRTPARRVVFNYEQRPDANHSFLSGLRLSRFHRIKSIEMHAPDPVTTAKLRSYEMEYVHGSTGRSLLASIVERDAAGIARPPHQFEYATNVPGYDEIETGISDVMTAPQGRNGLPGRIYAMDIDGDGRDDILYVSRTRPDVYSVRFSRTDGQGKPCFGPPIATTIPVSHRPERPMVLDFDGDGSADLLSYDDSGSIGNGIGGGYIISRGQPSSDQGIIPANVVPGDLVEVADFDGDGRPDLFVSDYNNNGTPFRAWSLAMHNGSTGWGPLNLFPEVLPDDHLLVDIDGDGATELLSSAGQINGPVSGWMNVFRIGRGGPIPAATSSLRTGQPYLFLGLTGSGLADVVWEGSNPNSPPSVIVNSGNGYLPPMVQPFGNYAYHGAPVKRSVDFDLDGRQEVIVRYNTSFAPDPVLVFGWNGQTLGAPTILNIGSICSDKEEAELFEVMDATGNGLGDLVMYNKGTLHLYIRRGDKPDLLVRSIDGFGAQIQVHYRPTSDPAVYEKGFRPVTYPAAQHRAGMWVVSAHEEANGIGGANHYTHRYVDGRIDARTSSFVGFRGYMRTHVETGEVRELDFDLSDRPGCGMRALASKPVLSRVTTPLSTGASHMLNVTTNYEISFDSTGRSYFAAPVETSITEGTDANYFYSSLELTIANGFDLYGNLTSTQTKWGSGRIRSTITTFDIDEPHWLISNPVLVESSDTTASGLSAVRRMAWEYDAFGFQSRAVVEPGANVGGSWQPLAPQADGISTFFRSFVRNADGQVTNETTHIDLPAGATARSAIYTYDAEEGIFPISATNMLGHKRSTTWHPGFGVVTGSSDENGAQATAVYDTFGRLRSQLLPGGRKFDFNYVDGPLNPPRVTMEQAGGPRIRLDHDELGRPISLSSWARDDGKEVVKRRAFDGQGRVNKTTLFDFANQPLRWSYYRYDELDRMLVANVPGGMSWHYAYGDTTLPYDGSAILRTTIIDPKGVVRYRYSDDSGRPSRSIDEGVVAVPVSRITYGPFDTVIGIAGPAGLETTYIYDRLGRVISVDDPDSGASTVEYTPFGDIAQATTPNGVIQYSYDAIGRTTQISSADGPTQFAWDQAPNGLGKVAMATGPTGISQGFAYDAAGRVSQRRWKGAGTNATFEYRYDGFGRLEGVHYPNDPSGDKIAVRYSYGDYGQILSVGDWSSPEIYWKHQSTDASGRFGAWQLPGKFVQRWTEHPTQPGMVGTVQTFKSSSMKLALSLDYDANGNLTSRKDLPSGTSETFGYDALDRLTAWYYVAAGSSGGSKFLYDPLSNLRARTGVNAAGFAMGGSHHQVVHSSYGDFAYDGSGNQTSAPGRSVTYNAFNAPTSATVGKAQFKYEYDGAGAPVLRSGGTSKTVTLAGLFERRGSGVGREHRYHVPVPGPASVQIVRTPSPNKNMTLGLYQDELGSVRYVAGKGSIGQKLAYDPFGHRVLPDKPDQWSGAPSSGIRAGFAGCEHDDELDLLRTGARFYDPKTARFASPDALIVNAASPSTLNPYSYAQNNPQSVSDPTGLDPDYIQFADDDVEANSPNPATVINFTEGETVIGSAPPVTFYEFEDDVIISDIVTFNDEVITSDLDMQSNLTPGVYGGFPDDVVYGQAGNSDNGVDPSSRRPVGSGSGNGASISAVPSSKPPQWTSRAANGLSVIGAFGSADSILAQFSLAALRAQSWLGGSRAVDTAAIALATKATSASNTLGKTLIFAKAGRTGLTAGRLLSGISFVGSAAGVAISMWSYRSATDRSERVQAVADGVFSAIGFTGVGTLGSAAYSLGQLADQLTGVSNFGYFIGSWTPMGRIGSKIADWTGL